MQKQAGIVLCRRATSGLLTAWSLTHCGEGWLRPPNLGWEVGGPETGQAPSLGPWVTVAKSLPLAGPQMKKQNPATSQGRPKIERHRASGYLSP